MTKQFVRPEYPHSETTANIIKAAKTVHRGLGPGFEEVIYQRALALEFAAEGLDFSREVWMDGCSLPEQKGWTQASRFYR